MSYLAFHGIDQIFFLHMKPKVGKLACGQTGERKIQFLQRESRNTDDACCRVIYSLDK